MGATDDVVVHEHRTTTEDGWWLQLRSTTAPRRIDVNRPPVLLVPGYGMNNFILGFHPRGTSLERHLAEAGFEVWSVNMRGQGGSSPLREEAPGPSLRAFVDHDVPTAVAAVLRKTATQSERVVLAGCSLGGTVAYAYAALEPAAPLAGVVSIGGPLRWDWAHPLVRVAFSSPALVGKLRLRGARSLARYALPVAAKLPLVLDIYMNRKHVDLSATDEMVKTVDDLHPGVNEDIARWIRGRDLILRGKNISEQIKKLRLPLLIVLANKDGVVPPAAVYPAEELWGGDVEVLHVGTEDGWYAHADLFVSDRAPQEVFEPLAGWLRRRPEA